MKNKFMSINFIQHIFFFPLDIHTIFFIEDETCELDQTTPSSSATPFVWVLTYVNILMKFIKNSQVKHTLL